MKQPSQPARSAAGRVPRAGRLGVVVEVRQPDRAPDHTASRSTAVVTAAEATTTRNGARAAARRPPRRARPRARRCPRRTSAPRSAPPAARPAAACATRCTRGAVEHALRDREPGELERVTARGGDQDRRPHITPPRESACALPSAAAPARAAATSPRAAAPRRPPPRPRRPRRRPAPARPPARTARDQRRDRGQRGDRLRLALLQARREQGEEGRRRGGVEAERARVGDRVAGERADQRREVPEDEDGEAGRPEARAACRPRVSRTAIAALSSITKCAASARGRTIRRQPQPVERVARAEQQRGRDRRGAHRRRSARRTRTATRR